MNGKSDFAELFRLYPECLSCLLEKLPYQYPDWASQNQKLAFMQSVLILLGNAGQSLSAPELVYQVDQLSVKMFGVSRDFSDVKFHFNEIMLAKKGTIRENIFSSPDPLQLAVQYAMIGNYIDFGAMKNVDEDALKQMLDSASELPVDASNLEFLRREILSRKTLTYILDNCGEIVLDMLMMEVIRKLNPGIEIRAIVRSGNTLNDANLDDARQVGLDREMKVIGNGNGVAGTCLNRLSEEARACIESADFLIAKGQANFETMNRCGKNIFYIFLCKCDFFASRFQVKKYTGMLIHERDL